MDDRRHLTLRIPLPRRRDLARSAVALGVAGLPVLRAWGLQWGAREDELEAHLPGDCLAPDADLVATRAIGLAAPPQDVWPWVVQLGQGRGGFSSYDALENLAGCRIRSADRAEPAWQDLAPGDTVRLHPRVALEVAAVDAGRALVLRSPCDAAAPYRFTWAFVVRPDGRGGTRLVVRERYAYLTAWARFAAEPACAVSAVMTRGLLRGVRRRVRGASNVIRPAG
ncbi:SRPBCC family protein [Cellulomonas wangsupingiae]|uniref:SRPBCC family protein n=1 Tax=Cellulomonas wangsupingiae TaxID=2968085 RepID=UPI001D0F0F87|nr:SRPBCC family protein [Cellulomonas wangsupingiae]MCM0639676.1 SRPBCC family protein [Cellulomonas wangsupingiae]